MSATDGAMFDLDEVRRKRKQSAGAADEPEVDVERSFPVLDPAALHGLAGQIVRAIEPNTEAAPVAVLANLLVYFGNAASRVAHALVGSKPHYLNLYAALVGESSKGRKGTSAAEIDALFAQADPLWHDTRIQGGLASGEGLIYAVRDPSDKIDKDGNLVDPGARDKRLLVVEEELSSVLKVAARDGNTTSPVLRQAWDSGKLRNLTKNNPLAATNAHISLLGHITITELRRLLSETETANGFANRFAWFCVRRSKLLPDGGNSPDYGPLTGRLTQALEFARTHDQPIYRDDDARAMWHRVYGALSDGKPGMAGAVTSRAEAQVLRLSTLYAVLDRSPVVRSDHLIAALALWQYAEASAIYIFASRAGDFVQDKIMAALKEAGGAGLDLTAIYKLFGGHVPSARRRAALDALEEQRLIVKREDNDTGGKKRTIYVAADE